jgi:tetratricopeptide (TPR) repeat protein
MDRFTFARPTLSGFLLTRRAIEGATYCPRLRFGLVSLPLLLALIFLGGATKPAQAADSQKETLDGLRAGGHYAEAIAYLQHARTDSHTDATFAETIDFELGVTEIDAAAGLAESDRDAHLQRAQQSLTKFLADHPQHVLCPAARAQLGNVLLDRGRLRRMMGGQFEGPTRQQHMEAARGLLRQAGEFWTVMDSAADEELKHIGLSGGNEIHRGEARDGVHRRQLQARLARAWLQYEIGQTFAIGSSERTAALQDAGRRFDAIYDQERDRLAGYYGRLGRGLCWKDLGEGEKALAVFEELFKLPDDPADFHALRGKAAVQALETSLAPEFKKYKSGLDIARQWLAGDRPRSGGSDVDLAVRFLGGEAALAYAKTLPADSPEQAAARNQQIEWARQQFNLVAASGGASKPPGFPLAGRGTTNGSWQAPGAAWSAKAKTRLADPLFGPTANAAEQAEPGSFAEARTRAKAALDRFLAAQAEQNAEPLGAAGNDRDAMRQRGQQIATARNEALKYCHLALDLSAPVGGARSEDYDTVRYYLAYLHYASGELEEAATLGEAAAQASSDATAARQAARIGLAAREALFRRVTEETRATATDRVQALAEKIIERWGNRAEADDARGILLDLALAEGRLEYAAQYLQQMSPDSPRRGEAEMNLGQAVWQRAQQLMRMSTLAHDHSEEAEKTVARAAILLTEGIAQSRKATDAAATSALAKGMLALAQIHMMSGQPAKALVLLDDPAMAASGDTYSMAILANLASGELGKAGLCLKKLQASLPPNGSPAAARQMLQTCVRTHSLLKQHLARYRERRQVDLAAKLVQNFDTFLASRADMPGSPGFFISAWRAEAYAGLADGLDTGGPGVLPAAEKQYRRALIALREILDRVEADASFSPSPDATVALRIELARCLRRVQDHQGAFFQLRIVLRDHPWMVDAQVEAAYTYQSWGDEKPECLQLAIQGGEQFREVWGWGELARRVQSESRFREVYHEARYNLALCRFHQAQIASDGFERTRLLDAAENDILVTQRSAPDLGGAIWYDRYDELFKRIQRLANRPATGLLKQ